MKDIHPLILCGGSGSRLWPMSRVQSPKQFHKINGQGSLTFFQSTVQRHRSVGFKDPVVVTAVQHQHTVLRQLSDLQCPADVICEPMGRNTGPAVLAAAIHIAKSDPDGLMLVLPSDHVISGELNSAILNQRDAALDGRIVIFGIKPTYPETGYGYITDGGEFNGLNQLHHVAAFVEKPPMEVAVSLLASGSAYWASGISLFTASTIIKEFRTFDPITYNAVFSAIDRGDSNREGLTLHPDSFRRARSEPTERIIFEKSPHVALAPLDVDWDDVGCWTSMHAIANRDNDGNAFHGDVLSVETTNALVKSDKRLVAVVGMSDVIVVDTPDALLVTQRGKCQDVKQVVQTLKSEERSEAVKPTAREYGWGHAMQVMHSDSFDMSLLKINPGATIKIDSLPGRTVIPVAGSLQVFDGLKRRNLPTGERLIVTSEGPTSLTNNESHSVEALLVTMNAGIVSDPYIDAVQSA